MADPLEQALQRRRAAQQQAAAMSPAQVQRVGELSDRYGLGLLSIPLSRAQADDDTALRVATSKARAERARVRVGQETTGGLMSQLWDSAVSSTKSVVRYGSAGAMFIPEYVQALARGTAAELGVGEGEGLNGLGGTLRQTTIGAGVREAKDRGQLGSMFLGRGDEKLSGDGWFINPKTSIVGRRQAREARASQLVEGEDGKTHAGTLGRNIAGLLPVEAGSVPYNIVSGTVDFGVQLTMPGPKGGGRAAAAAGRTRNVWDSGPNVTVDLPVKVPERTVVMRRGVGDWNDIDPSTGKPYGSAEEFLDAHQLERNGDWGTWWAKSDDAGMAEHNGGNVGTIITAEFPESAVRRSDNAGWRITEAKGRVVGVTAAGRDLPLSSPRAIGAGLPTTPGENALEVGLVDGIRPTALPEKFASWVTAADKGGPVMQRLADVSPDDPMAFNTIWRGTNKKLPVSVVVALVDATDPVDVQNILVNAVKAGSARETVTFAQKKAPSRIGSMMPATKVDLDDTDDVVEQLDRFQRNNLTPEAEISANNLTLARAVSKGERYALVDGILKVVKSGLVAKGFSEREAATYVRMFGDAREGNRLYGVERIADDAGVRFGRSVKLGGTDIEIDGPHRTVQLIDRYLPLPNARDLKKANRQMQWVRDLQTSAPYEVSADFLDFATQSVFKPLALVTRPAYPIRVIGEEQARMGAAGYASMFRHPASYFAVLAGAKPTVAAKGVNAAGEEVSEEVPNLIYQFMAKRRDASNFGGDAVGGRFDDEDLVEGVSKLKQSLSVDSGGWIDRVIGASPRHYVPLKPTDEGFSDGWLRHELIELASDPVGREIARKGSEAVKDLFWDGPLQGLRKDLGRSMKDTKGRPIDLNDRAISDAYVDMMAGEVSKFTLDQPDLMRAVAHGKLRGTPLSDGLAPNKKALAMLERMVDQGVAPKAVRGTVDDPAAGSPAANMLRHYESAVQEGFRLLMGVPTNKLSRAPVFKQAYWLRMNELVPLMTTADRAALLRGAKEAGVDKKILDTMRSRVRENTNQSGALALENADTVAKHFALGETRNLLYSLHEKAQIADAMRVIFPFGEAWREVLTRWTKLGTENPSVGYRALQALPAANRAGLFYPDPTTGQEMFAIPGSEWASEQLTGVPMKMEATAAGLSMFGSVLPGVGFAVSMPMSKMLPDHPSTDFVRELVLPFGDPDTGGGILETFFPAYMKRLTAAAGFHPSPRSQRQMAATTRDVAAYLVSTGSYDLSSAEGQEKLFADAEHKARALFIIRGIAQSTAPSAPTVKFYAQDKSGKMALLYELQADMRKMMDQDFESATERFIKKWGENAFLATIPKTTGSLYSITDKVNDFARANPSQARRFPGVVGLFAPSGPDQEIAIGETERQINAGVREVTSLEDAVKLNNIRLATLLYDRAKTRLGDDDRALWAVQDKLKDRYPGYTGSGGDLSKGPGSVQELIRASEDPVLAGTDAGKGLVLYLEARDEALADARAAGLKGFDRAAAAEPLRKWLDDTATWVLDQHPGFIDMWERVLSREVEGAA